MTDAEKLANDISSSMADAPKLHELEDGETVELSISYSNNRRFEGISIGFHFGTKANEIHDAVKETVEPRLDKRKFKLPDDRRRGKSWSIGFIEVNGDGELVDYEIDESYLKPTEKND